jgi:sugar O-acyltransferase (sialic acid O-acetyltransferase NeuD family)
LPDKYPEQFGLGQAFMTERPGLILIGAGGHARACIDVLEEHGGYRIAGLVGLEVEMHNQYYGYAVIGTDSELPELARTYRHAIIAAGQIQSPDTRIRLFRRAVECGFELPAIIAPTAHVSCHAAIGAGTIVMHGAIVNAGARVGDNSIINSRALIEHDATVGNHCHVSTGAILNGNAHVGDGSFVGSGSVVKEGIRIGERCVVGMGLSVRHQQLGGLRYLGETK